MKWCAFHVFLSVWFKCAQNRCQPQETFSFYCVFWAYLSRVRLEVSVAVLLRPQVCWGVTLCSEISVFRRFEGTYCLYYNGWGIQKEWTDMGLMVRLVRSRNFEPIGPTHAYLVPPRNSLIGSLWFSSLHTGCTDRAHLHLLARHCFLTFQQPGEQTYTYMHLSPAFGIRLGPLDPWRCWHCWEVLTQRQGVTYQKIWILSTQ